LAVHGVWIRRWKSRGISMEKSKEQKVLYKVDQLGVNTILKGLSLIVAKDVTINTQDRMVATRLLDEVSAKRKAMGEVEIVEVDGRDYNGNVVADKPVIEKEN
jgi:hypothetical protein